MHLEENSAQSLRGTNPPGAREALVQIQQAPILQGVASGNSHSSTASSSGLPRNSFGDRLHSSLGIDYNLSGDPAQIDRLRPLGEPREQNPSGPATVLAEAARIRSEQAEAERIRLGSWRTSDFYSTYAPDSRNNSEELVSDWISSNRTNVVNLPVEHPPLGLLLPELSPDRYSRAHQRRNQRRSCTHQEGFLKRGNPNWLPWYPRPDSAEETYPILEDLGLRVGRSLQNLSFTGGGGRVGPRLLVRFLLAFWNGFIKGIGHSYPATRLASGARLTRSADPRGPIVDILEIVEDPPLPPSRVFRDGLPEGIYLAARNPLAADGYSEYSDPPSTLDDGYAEPTGGTGSAGHSME